MMNPHAITAEFETALCEYTKAPYAVALDNCSNALFLALMWWKLHNANTKYITIPSNTYPSVPCEIIHAGMRSRFESKTFSGVYQLWPTNVWDCALRFTTGMYISGQLQCLSFTGPFKHLKLSKGGAILTDNEDAYKWFKRVRFSGRRECSYHVDNLDMLGWNFYMMPELAARGLLLMAQFYDKEGNPKRNEDIVLPYPDLSKFKVYDSDNR